MIAEVAAILGAVAAILAIAVGLYVKLASLAWHTRQADIDRQLAEQKKALETGAEDRKELTEKLHGVELKNAHLEGEHGALNQRVMSIAKSLDEVKDQQVPRSEWEAHTQSVDNQLRQIVARLDRKYPSDPAMPVRK